MGGQCRTHKTRAAGADQFVGVLGHHVVQESLGGQHEVGAAAGGPLWRGRRGHRGGPVHGVGGKMHLGIGLVSDDLQGVRVHQKIIVP